jgi:diguanylate cyclase (GGDEF)-like protein
MRNQTMIWNTDTTLRVTSLTARLRGFAEIGTRTGDLHVSDLWDDPDPFPVLAHYRALSGETLAFEARVRGTHLAFEVEPLLDPEGAIAGVTGRAVEIVSSDDREYIARLVAEITDLKAREAELSELALRDGLTRLPNRAAFEEHLRASLARCERNRCRCALFFIDLDDFKAINDAFGHAYGDRVLVAIADRLTRHVRASDMVARFGGDEFVILIDDLSSDEAAAEAARKLLCCLDEPFHISDAQIRVTASIGVATYPGTCSSPATVVASADHEMYAVKRNGGNGIKIGTAWRAHSSPAQTPCATAESA